MQVVRERPVVCAEQVPNALIRADGSTSKESARGPPDRPWPRVQPGRRRAAPSASMRHSCPPRSGHARA